MNLQIRSTPEAVSTRSRTGMWAIEEREEYTHSWRTYHTVLIDLHIMNLIYF